MLEMTMAAWPRPVEDAESDEDEDDFSMCPLFTADGDESLPKRNLDALFASTPTLPKKRSMPNVSVDEEESGGEPRPLPTARSGPGGATAAELAWERTAQVCSLLFFPSSHLSPSPRDAPGTRPERIAHPAHRNPPRADPDTPDTSLPVTLSSIARRSGSDDAPRRGTFVTTRRTRRFTTSRVRWRLLARAGARARDPKRRLRRYRFRVRVRLRGCLFFGRRGRFARAARRRSGDRRDERRGTSVEGLGATRRVVFGARRRGVAGDAVPTKRRRDGRREGCVFFSSREDSPGGGRVSAALSARANRASDAERVVHVASLVRSASTRLRVDA